MAHKFQKVLPMVSGLLCVTFLCISARAACSVPSFAAATNFPAGSQPLSVGTGDLNSDENEIRRRQLQLEHNLNPLRQWHRGFRSGCNLPCGNQPKRRGRAEMPCGLKSCSGGFGGHSPTSCRFALNSATRPGVPPVWEPICVTRNPPSFNGRKSSVMLESVPLVENRNLGWRAFDTSKKKMLF